MSAPAVLILPDMDRAFAAEQRRRAELRAIEDRDAVRSECASLAGFIKHAWHVLEPSQPYVHGWHIDAICAHLEAVTDGFITRLLINVPPGTMKSLIVSVFWPAWEWGPRNLPHMRYLATSYERELVYRDNNRMKNLISSEWYQSFWGDRVMLTSRGTRKFANSATGSREGRAFGSMTGGRGDRVLIDDPHSTKTADSDTVRTATTTLFKEAIPTRLNNPDSSAIIIIMQRLHERDVSGVALGLEQGYVHLRLPMRFESEPQRQSDGTEIGGPCVTRLGPGVTFRDPRTVDGELLFPSRFPKLVVDRDERALGPYATAGQMQQRPTPRTGGLFDVDLIEEVAMAPPMQKLVRAWDLASTKKKLGKRDPDFTAGVLLGKGLDGFYYIVDARRFQERSAKVRQNIKATATQDGTGTYIRIPNDPGQAGNDQSDSYAQLLAGYMIKAVPPTGDKETRATPLASMIGFGLVKMVKGAWNQAFKDELRAFPNGAHDDQVDAAADAFNEVAGIVPGEGLLEFYRQEAERAALASLGGDDDKPKPGREGKIGYRPPQGVQMAIGRSGFMYRMDELGIIWLDPTDKAIAGEGWVEVDPEEGAA
jgi:predicted phage terminase large subunit-like protein